MKARLCTQSGHDVLGEAFTMPPFLTKPQVVMWGTRVFLLETTPAPDGSALYREVFAVSADPYIQARAPSAA